MKVQLVSPHHDRSGRATNAPMPPIGLCLMAAALRARVRDEGRQGPELEILDESILGAAAVEARLDAAVVGFTDLFSNHERCLALARLAHDRGAKVVLGGANAGHLAARILRNHDFVDHVVVGDGERALCDLVLGVPLNEIANLVWRDGAEIRHNPVEQVDIETLPLFSLDDLVGADCYTKGHGPWPICSIRGCARAVEAGRCRYCAIPSVGLRVLSPKRAWQQIELLSERYGARSFFEAGDCFFVPSPGERGVSCRPRSYPEALLDARPPGLSAELRIYERPGVLNRKRIDVLKQLGVTEIFIGFEHIERRIRVDSRRPSWRGDAHDLIDMLSQAGIAVVTAFVFGLPGETSSSAARNRDFVLDVVERHPNVTKAFVSVAVPLVGSALFHEALADDWIIDQYARNGGDLRADDTLDYNLLSRLAIERTCSVAPDELAAVIDDLHRSLLPDRCASYGSVMLRPSN